MAGGILGALIAAPEVIKGITDLIGRFVPDPAQAAQAALEMQKLVAEREAAAAQAAAEVAKAQAETNTAEAGNASLFVSGWRPFIGWVCGWGCVYGFIAQPLLAWAAGLIGAALGAALPAPPACDIVQLMGLLGGMLGLGAMRTVEKAQGVPDTAVTLLRKK